MTFLFFVNKLNKLVVYPIVGKFVNHGGSGGRGAGNGAAGTVYLHKLPDFMNGTIPDHFYENRTLYINNNNLEVVDVNLTSLYPDYTMATGVTWLWPGPYPSHLQVSQPNLNSDNGIVLDYLQVYYFL